MTTLDDVIRTLQDGTSSQKQHALRELEQWGCAAVEPLVQAVSQADDQDIDHILQGFEHEAGEGQRSNPPFTLIEAALPYNSWYVAAASLHLIDCRNTALPRLVPLLQDERPWVRAWCAYLLGQIRENRAIEPLLRRLDTDSTEELIQVCAALGNLRARQAVERLILFLDHEDIGVQSSAATALGAIGDRRALMPLINQLKQHKQSVYSVSAALYHFGRDAVLPLVDVLRDPAATHVYDLVLMELSMLEDRRAIKPVLELLNSTLLVVKAERSPSLRLLAASEESEITYGSIVTLGNLKAQEALEPISKVLFQTRDFSMRQVAAHAIAQIGSQDALKVLISAIEHGTHEVQQAAVLAFGAMEGTQALQPLLTVLSHANPNLRSSAAVSLGNLRAKQAVDALRSALNDPDEGTRYYASDALQKIEQGSDDL
jgi:HEAT repeat protein